MADLQLFLTDIMKKMYKKFRKRRFFFINKKGELIIKLLVLTQTLLFKVRLYVVLATAHGTWETFTLVEPLIQAQKKRYCRYKPSLKKSARNVRALMNSLTMPKNAQIYVTNS